MSPSEEQRVEAQLRRICTSREFLTKPRQQLLLTFLVQEAIAGTSSQVTSSVLAAAVLKTDKDRDARREVGRLRTVLLSYYAKYDDPDPLRIEIPEEGYQLTFSSLDVLVPTVTDCVPEEIPTALAETERTTDTKVDQVESGPTAGPPLRISSPWRRWQLIAVAAAIVSVSAGLVVLSKMRSPKLPADVLIIGLAKFSPTTPATEILRNRIQQALESRVYGGPLVEVRLLNDDLNADEPDLQKQARTISGNGVHLVIGARAFDQYAYRPRMAMAQPYHSLTLNNELADTLETLHLGVNIDGSEAGYQAATLFFSDLIKIIYSYQYFP